MEHGDRCALRWVDSECVLALAGWLCFHSDAPVDGEQLTGAKSRKGGNLTRASCKLDGNIQVIGVTNQEMLMRC